MKEQIANAATAVLLAHEQMKIIAVAEPDKTKAAFSAIKTSFLRLRALLNAEIVIKLDIQDVLTTITTALNETNKISLTLDSLLTIASAIAEGKTAESQSAKEYGPVLATQYRHALEAAMQLHNALTFLQPSSDAQLEPKKQPAFKSF